MKINHIITTISYGGAENQLLILVKEQIKQGHDVTVYPLKGKIQLSDFFISSGAKVDMVFHNIGFIKQIFAIRKIKFLPREVIHAHLPQAEILMYFAKCNLKISSRHFGGKFYPKAPKFISTLLSRFFLRNTKEVIAISDFVKTYLLDSGEISRNQEITTIKYGFDAEEFKKSISIHNQIPAKEIARCGTLARLSPEKDLQTLIKSIAICKNKFNRKFELHLYGEGNEESKLRNLANSLGIDKEVIFHGKTQSPADAFKSFDLFILTSRFEGFGMVLLEAMAMGNRIIASNIPTAHEVLGDDGAAVYFETGNPYDLAEKMLAIGSISTDNYEELQAARLELFSANAMAKKIESVYYSN